MKFIMAYTMQIDDPFLCFGIKDVECPILREILYQLPNGETYFEKDFVIKRVK